MVDEFQYGHPAETPETSRLRPRLPMASLNAVDKNWPRRYPPPGPLRPGWNNRNFGN
jgi:hypothetical protein